jgi:hypothetical protein
MPALPCTLIYASQLEPGRAVGIGKNSEYSNEIEWGARTCVTIGFETSTLLQRLGQSSHLRREENKSYCPARYSRRLRLVVRIGGSLWISYFPLNSPETIRSAFFTRITTLRG